MHHGHDTSLARVSSPSHCRPRVLVDRCELTNYPVEQETRLAFAEVMECCDVPGSAFAPGKRSVVAEVDTARAHTAGHAVAGRVGKQASLAAECCRPGTVANESRPVQPTIKIEVEKAA